MDKRLVVLAMLLGLAAAAYPALSAPPGLPQVRAFTFEVTASSCAFDDGVCLAYNGQVPGPLLDVNLGDTIKVTLVNRIAQTLPPSAPAHLASARVSWHVHGTAVSLESDGVGPSSAGPGETYTYTTRAAFAGSWHYHDHVIGLDGDEGSSRGLYGGLVVRNGAEPRADAVFDLHALDEGVNGGRGMNATLAAGSDFEILVVGLENLPRTFTLRDPGGALVDRIQTWPGLSERMRVDDAVAGVYRWTATGSGVKTGTVIVS